MLLCYKLHFVIRCANCAGCPGTCHRSAVAGRVATMLLRLEKWPSQTIKPKDDVPYVHLLHRMLHTVGASIFMGNGGAKSDLNIYAMYAKRMMRRRICVCVWLLWRAGLRLLREVWHNLRSDDHVHEVRVFVPYTRSPWHCIEIDDYNYRYSRRRPSVSFIPFAPATRQMYDSIKMAATRQRFRDDHK